MPCEQFGRERGGVRPRSGSDPKTSTTGVRPRQGSDPFTWPIRSHPQLCRSCTATSGTSVITQPTAGSASRS